MVSPSVVLVSSFSFGNLLLASVVPQSIFVVVLSLFFYLLLFLLLVTVCSEQGNTTCLGNNTICLNDGTTESCGNCIAGFIDLDEIFNSTEGCQDIEELSLEEYFDRVQPIYKNTSDELQALRLEQLKLTLTFISEHEAKIPPGAYSLEVNEFSAHLPEDHKNHAGTKAKTDDLGFDRFQPNRRLQTSNLPPAIDWEQLGATTSVKNQVWLSYGTVIKCSMMMMMCRSSVCCYFLVFLHSCISDSLELFLSIPLVSCFSGKLRLLLVH